ncbi:hypothetical protein ILYODFUR_013117 [Ilyodon furcidens]|uniref:Uncharacterized protein n=1 Tax=Ilyodon furcidens TaxID=33524 RepID=A0ABV0TVF0_9TELE
MSQQQSFQQSSLWFLWSRILLINLHSLFPLGAFHFYEAEEDICLHLWPLQESWGGGGNFGFCMELYNVKMLFLYLFLSLSTHLPDLLMLQYHTPGVHELSCNTVKEGKCSAGVLFYSS